MSERLGRDNVGIAWDIAKMLEDNAIDGPRACAVLAMAMGIICEGTDGSHREMIPLAEVLNRCAKDTFDALREARLHGYE